MGNKQANQTNLSLTNQVREDWTKIEDQGYCELWGNKKTNQRFQAYPISDATARDNVQIEKYAFRKIHNAYLVSAQAIITQNQTFLCSQPTTSFVLIENITNRLRSFSKTFTFEESLYILSCSATGYNTLCSFFGPLEPNEDLICFNDTGNVKVWLNQNLSKNQASFHSSKNLEVELPKNDDYNYAKRRSRQCVQKLLKIVQNSTVNGYPRNFQEETKNLSTFFEISNFIDYFCEQNMIKMPNYINLNRPQPVMITSPSRQFVNYTHQVENPVQILQSSRVSKVFRSNHEREGLVLSSPPPPPSYHFNTNFQPRYQVHPVTIQFNQVPNQIQNHQITYNSPVVVQQSINRHVIIPNNPNPLPQNIIFPLRTLNQGTKIICPDEPAVQNVAVVLSTKTNNITPFQPQQVIKQQFQTQQPIRKLQQLNSQHDSQIIQAVNQYPIQEQKTSQKQFEQQEQQHYLSQDNIEQHQQQYHHQPQHQQVKSVQDQPNIQQQEQSYYKNHQEEHQYYSHQNSQQINNQNNQQTQQQVTESAYSHIERYVPPITIPSHQPILQTKQEQVSSPKKSFQILQWEHKLNQFTQSKQQPKLFNQQPSNETQQSKDIQTRQPQSFKNLIVSEQSQEYVNQLADLQNDDIQKYIRMKYQSYLNQKKQPESANAQYIASKPKNYLTSADKFRSHAQQTEYQHYNQQQYQYKPYQLYQPQQRQVYQQDTQKQNLPAKYDYYGYGSLGNNRISIEQDFQSSPSNSGKYLRKNYQNKYDQQDQINLQLFQQNYQARKNPSRNNSRRASNIIDERYNKYVLNSKQPKKTIYNNTSQYNNMSQEVSLLLPADQSNFIRQNNRPILQKSFKQQSNRQSQKKGVTYQKLRNLLWEQ